MPNIGDIETRGMRKRYIWVECPDCHKQRWKDLYSYTHNPLGLCPKCHDRRNVLLRYGNLDNEFMVLDGYVLVISPNQNRPRLQNRRIKRAILVLESKLGRLLNSDEVPHHINCIKADDRPENLIVLTRKEHSRLHAHLVANTRRLKFSYFEGEIPLIT